MAAYVTYRPLGTTNEQYQAYVDALLERGIDVKSRPRIPEPGTSRRWLHAWQTPEAAEEFAAAMRAKSKDPSWRVHKFDDAAIFDQTPNGLTIYRRREAEGNTFGLEENSRISIATAFPHANLWPRIFVGFQTQFDYEKEIGPMWEQIAIFLTGLTASQRTSLGGVRLIDAHTGEVIWSKP